MRNKIFTLSIFAILASLLMLTLASAASTVLDSKNLSSLTVSANPGSTVTLQFNVNYTGTSNSAVVSFSVAGSSSGWTFPASPAQNTTLSENEARTFTVTYVVPSSASGVITNTVQIGSSTGSGTDDFAVTINVNSGPSNLELAKTGDLSRTQNGTLTIKNTGSTDLNSVSLVRSAGPSVAFSDNNFALDAGQTRTIALSLNNPDTVNFGSNSVTIHATSASTPQSNSIQFSFTSGMCTAPSPQVNISVSDFDVSNDGEDDDIWRPLDTITVEVEVDNDGDEDVNDVIVELGLFDSTGENMIDDVDFSDSDDEEKEMGDIRDGDKETVTFEFEVPADLDEGSYTFAVKAYSDDAREAECADDVFDIDVESEDDEGKFISFTKEELSPSELTCGDSAVLDFDVYNIGEDDQDQVRVTVTSRELELDMSREIKNNFDTGDKESLSFSFEVPEGIRDGTYNIELNAEYDYKSGTYREELDEPEMFSVKVIGCSEVPDNGNAPQVSISADLDSEAVAGKEMKVISTIRNTGSQSANFVIGVSEYSDWADLVDISDRILTLAPGQSDQVEITLMVNAEAEGTQQFTIEVNSNGETQTRDVEVELAAKSGSGVSLGSNGIIWIIVAVNIVLIILIILVAVRVSRR